MVALLWCFLRWWCGCVLWPCGTIFQLHACLFGSSECQHGPLGAPWHGSLVVVVLVVWLCFWCGCVFVVVCGGVFVVVLWLCLCGPVGGVFLWSCGGAFVQKFLLAPAYAHCKT